MPMVNGQYRRPQLRNANINYNEGWFFVTFQVFENKSVLGAIVGEECVLNKLGLAVKGLIETLPQYNPGVFVDCFVVMPNHVHLVLKLSAPSLSGSRGVAPRQISGSRGVAPCQISGSRGVAPLFSGGRGVAPCHLLGKIMMKLKSLAAREYRLLKERGEARDIGSHLWQANYWEKIITTHEQLEAIRNYIANNPKRWSTDRFGPVTTYSLGNLALLDEPFVAFVASQEARGDTLAPREWARGDTLAPREWARGDKNLGARGRSPSPNLGGQGRRPLPPTVISTFTSPQEREILRRLISRERRFIAIYPGGLPAVLPPAIAAAVEAGRALLLSPVASGTGVNKQRAVWCNEYVIRRATKVYCGFIKPGGTLESILKTAR